MYNHNVSLTHASFRPTINCLRWHLGVILFYTLAAVILTWPLAGHFTTHMPGDGIDDPSLGWNLWWLKHRLLDQVNPDIFHVGWMFHPIGINLAFYTLTPLNGLLSVPLQTVFGLVVANNIILLSSFVLAGYGAYLLCYEQLSRIEYRVMAGLRAQLLNTRYSTRVRQYAALAAGFIYAFASSKLFYAALGQFNIASSQWIPFCLLYVLRIGRGAGMRSTLRNAALAGLFLVFQAWAELTYATFLLIFIAIYALWLAGGWIYSSLVTRHSSLVTHHSSRIGAAFVLMAALFLAGIYPFLGAMLPDMRSEGDFFTSGGGFSAAFSADLAGYLVPTRLHPLLGDWVASLPFANDVGQQVFLGYSVLGISAFGVIVLLRSLQPAIRHWGWFWLCNTLFFGWMTLGPHIRWLGRELPIPGPFAWISQLPFFNGNRYPSRYSVMLLLCVAVLAGYGVYRLLRGRPRSRIEDRVGGDGRNIRYSILGLLAMLFLFEHIAAPLPLNDFRIPEIYRTLAATGARDEGDAAVLELPTGWRNGARVLGKSDKLIMMQQWYQTTHGQRRLGGNTSRNPPYKFQYFSTAPLIGDLIALMNANEHWMAPVVEAELDAMIARNRPIAAQTLHALGVRHVTVHVEKSPPALLRFVAEALPVTLVDAWEGKDWEGQPSTIRLYAVEPYTSPAGWEANLATQSGNLHLAEGWSTVIAADERIRYATRTEATALLNLPVEGGSLELELFGPATGVDVSLNGVLLGSTPLSGGPDGQWLTLTIPPGVADVTVDRLAFRFSGPLTQVAELGYSADRKNQGTTGAGAPISLSASLVVQSAGKDVGDFAHIWANGRQVARGEIGYNLVALDHNANVLDSVVFNTFADPAQSAALAAWVQRLPPGTIIAGAVMDEASSQLQAEAVAALAGLGVTGDLRGKFRWSHAFIGVAGAGAPRVSRSAHEAMQLLQPATVYVGAPVNGAAVSGGIGRVRFEAVAGRMPSANP
jgi:hypothetical protein